MKILLLSLLCLLAQAGEVKLAWDVPDTTGPTITGYKLHYGDTQGVYTTTVDVGLTYNATLTGLPDGTRLFTVVTAYSLSAESLPSNEVSFTTELAPPTNLRIILETSSNLQDWEPLAIVFEELEDAKFYRVKVESNTP